MRDILAIDPRHAMTRQNLVELLRAPATASPKSLREQLDLVRQLWRPLIGDILDRHLQIAGEILHEEELAIWMQFNTPAAMARRAAEEAVLGKYAFGSPEGYAHLAIRQLRLGCGAFAGRCQRCGRRFR